MKLTFPLFILFLLGCALVYSFWGESQFAIYFGNAIQGAALLIAGYNLYLVTDSLRRGDAPRKAWARLGVGMWIWIMGQCLETYCELVLGKVAYGTIADSFWLIGYLPLISGIYLFFRNFRSTGLSIGSSRGFTVLILIVSGVYASIFAGLIWPHITDPDRRLVVRFLDIAYPTLDFVIIAVASVLIRISLGMGGGSLAKTWFLLCLGFVLTAIADLLLQASEDVSSTYSHMIDVLYFSAYFLVALSARNQLVQSVCKTQPT